MSHVCLKKFWLWSPLMGLILLAGSAAAQNGIIQGTVVDPVQSAIVNAKVSAVDESKGLVIREVVSDGQGSFQLQPLSPGIYTIRIASPGMKALERTKINLDVNQILNLGPLQMEVGASTEQISVVDTSPQVETTTANKSFVIDSKQVTEISLNGRDFQSLIRTLPGVVSNDSSDFRLAFNNTDSFHVNGGRGSANNVFLDGSVNTDVGANDGQYTQLSLDAVGEFKVQASSFAAEYGRNVGVLISANTKSGGQAFHGTLYEFARNDAFDANSFFNNLQGQNKSKLRFNQFGGNLGGPVYIPKLSTPSNKKLFFFFNYEGTRASRPSGGTYYDVPSPQILSGDFRQQYRNNADGTPVLIAGTKFPIGTVFVPGTLQRDNGGNVIGGTPFPNNIVPPSIFSKNAPAWTKLLSRAYRGQTNFAATPGTPDSVRIPFQDTYNFNKNQKVVRADYTVSSKMNMFFRWVDDAQQESQQFGIFSGNAFPILPQFREKPGASYSFNVINVISPTATNEFIFTYNHLNQVVDITNGTSPATYDKNQLGFTYQDLYPQSNIRNKFPKFGAGGFYSYSFPPNWRSEGKTFAATDNFTKILGTHTFKAGLYFNLNQNGQQPYWTDAPQFDFNPNQLNPNDTNSGVANLLLGNYTSVSQANGVFYGTFRFIQPEVYAQDSWKVSNKLTLEYGLRWAYLGPTYTYGKYLQNYFDPKRYDPAQAVQINTAPGLQQGSIVPNSGNPFNGLVQENSKGVEKGFSQHRFNNFGPRFGFAYDPTGVGKTAIRGGFGVFYERIRQNINSFDGLGNPPLSYTPNLYLGNIDNLSPALVASGTRYPVGINAFNQNGKIPTTYGYSFGIQQQLTGNTSLDIAYVGNLSRHLQYQLDLNQLPLGTTTNSNILATVNNQQNAIRPFKGFTNVNFTDYGANSNYNALQMRLSRRFTRSLLLTADYTWSKALNTGDNDGDQIAYFLDRHREYGPAGYDRTNVFNLTYVYTLPELRNKGALLKYVVGGWEMAGITRFWSGQPFNITSNGNPGTLGGGVRPDYAGGAITPNQNRLQWFNPLAFSRPADGSLGNVGRNTLRGPGINNWDISLFKNLNFTERIRIQLRLETFNTFNHTQYSGINTGLNAPNPGDRISGATIGSAGQITGTRDPRTVQLGGKFLF